VAVDSKSGTGIAALKAALVDRASKHPKLENDVPLSFDQLQKKLDALSESKVFSIYAVGVVKGYKRETRSLVQAVVDYRDAPTLDGKGSASGAPAQLKGNEAFLSVLAPNPGGRLLYFRVE
jgi:hypothetical protein